MKYLSYTFAALFFIWIISSLGWVFWVFLLAFVVVSACLASKEDQSLTEEERVERRRQKSEERDMRRMAQIDEERRQRIYEMELEAAKKNQTSNWKSQAAGAVGKVALAAIIKAATGHHHKHH